VSVHLQRRRPSPIPGNVGGSEFRNWAHVSGEATGAPDSSSPSPAMAKEPGRLSLSVPLPQRRRRILSPLRPQRNQGAPGAAWFFFVFVRERR